MPLFLFEKCCRSKTLEQQRRRQQPQRFLTCEQILWMKWMLVDVSVAEKADKDGKKVLEVHMPSYLPGRPRSDRRIMTPDDAKMVLELVKVRPPVHTCPCAHFVNPRALVFWLPCWMLSLSLCTQGIKVKQRCNGGQSRPDWSPELLSARFGMLWGTFFGALRSSRGSSLGSSGVAHF